MGEYSIGYLDDLRSHLSDAEEDAFVALYYTEDRGVDFGEDTSTSLFVVDDIDWLIDQGLVEKTGKYIYDRTYWALTDDGYELAEDYVAFFDL